MKWYEVCRSEALWPERGSAALLGGQVIALFRTRSEELYAVGNIDPCTGVSAMSRGIVGDRGGEPTVASPLHKQVFSLRTGECLNEDARLPTYPVRDRGGVVEVGLP